jgi:flagellar motor switch protein FliM
MKVIETNAHVWSESETQALNIKPVKRIEDLYSNTAIALRRLPYLEIICDRFVRKLASSFRGLANDVAVVSVEMITSERLDEVVPSISSTSLTGIFRLDPQGGLGMMCLDQKLVYLFVDMLLGGRHASLNAIDESRGYTSIERNLIERVLKVMFADFSEVYEVDKPVEFVFERLEVNTRFAMIDKPTASVFHIKVKVDLEDRSGLFDIVLPFGTIEHIFANITPYQLPEQDPFWQKTLLSELEETSFTLEVVLDQTDKFLSDVMSWKKGSQVALLKSPESLVIISCEGKPMFTAKVGHMGPRIAVSIEEIIP